MKMPSAATIVAIGTAISVVLGGAELRLKVGDIDNRLSTVERRLDRVLDRAELAHNDQGEP